MTYSGQTLKKLKLNPPTLKYIQGELLIATFVVAMCEGCLS